MASMAFLSAVSTAWKVARKTGRQAAAERSSAAAWHTVPPIFDEAGHGRQMEGAAEAAAYAAMAACLSDRLDPQAIDIITRGWRDVIDTPQPEPEGPAR